MSTKFLAIGVVLGIVSDEGNVIPLHIFPTGHRVNIEEYLEAMKAVVKSRMDQIA